ncbi:MAG: DEAD/DEAH box helicase, partial [Flavobacteriales bacterium]|nr:DEAD/DEAH box helicase [Flavobacteriales bacterium]
MAENFEALGVSKDLIKGLNELDIVSPTGIQSEVIPVLLGEITDLVGQAQTGTGKTAAYGLPLLHRIDPALKEVQGLVLCPTRELSQQVAKQLFKFTKYTEKIFAEAVYGGPQIERQIQALQRPTHIVVATPGRLIDLIHRKAVDIRKVKTLILDEADEMLSMGFKKELDEIFGYIPEVECRWLFSATMPQGIKQIVNEHMSDDAYRIEVSSQNVVNKNIDHKYLICEEGDKLQVLMQFLKSEREERGLVFCRTKAATQRLAKQLIAKNVAADAIHGDLKQIERDKVMRAFKKERIKILVATDLAARGIDIESLAFVVHYQLPDKDEYYTHRSGRTARAG